MPTRFMPPTPLHPSTKLSAPYTAASIFEAARYKDPLAIDVVQKVAERIALYIAAMSAVADVELVILSGGIGRRGGGEGEREKGDGRVKDRTILLVVPRTDVWGPDYGPVRDRLRAKGAEVVTASSMRGRCRLHKESPDQTNAPSDSLRPI